MAMQGYLLGIWPPNKTNPLLAYWIQPIMIRAHRYAYSSIKSVNKSYKVGIVKQIVWDETFSHKMHFLDQLYTKFLYFLRTDFFLGPIKNHLDLIGVNYYFTNRIRNLYAQNPDDKTSDLGWWLYPPGLEKVLLSLKKYNLPIYITENGLADAKDKKRVWFLKECLKQCAKAIEKGVDLRGYFHWSLLDNYEWHHGFWPRFGLVEVDRENNLARKMRKSAEVYAKICKENEI